MSRIDAGFDASKISLNSDTHKVLIIEANSHKLIRFDTKKELNTLVLNINPAQNVDLDSLVNDLKSQDSNINVTIFEAKTNW